MKNAEKINYRGIEIFYLDFSELKAESEIQYLINDGKSLIRSQRVNSVYCLSNLENIHFSSNIKDMFIEFVKGNKSFMKASAVIGVSGIAQIVFNGVMKITGRAVRSFANAEAAKEWLISHP